MAFKRRYRWSRLAMAAELLVVTAGSVVALATNAWRHKSMTLIERLRPRPAHPAVYDEGELEGLPGPVARYFRAVLRNGQPIIRYAELSQRGRFLVPPGRSGWRRFYAMHHVAPTSVSFLWDASIRLLPGIAVLVRDSFIDGAGAMRADMMAVWPLIDVEGTPDMAAGALQRYLAEAAWVPTALLPSQGVRWSPIDEKSASASITVGATTVSLDFTFAADGTVSSVFTNARARAVGASFVLTPWQGRFSRYAEMHGMKIPLCVEVEWLLPEGPQPYWIGEITATLYE